MVLSVVSGSTAWIAVTFRSPRSFKAVACGQTTAAMLGKGQAAFLAESRPIA